MLHINRKQFLDRYLDSEDLVTLTRLWFAWFHYRQGEAGIQPWRGRSFFHMEARLWGFPRAEAELFRQKVAYRLETLAATHAEVVLHDPDTISLRAPVIAGPADLPDFGPWLDLVASSGFEGICCQFRLSVRDEAAEASEGRTGRGNTLVLFGVIQGARYLLKAAFPAGRDGHEEAMFAYTPWPEETKLIAALYDAHTGRITLATPPPAWAVTLEPALSTFSTYLMRFLSPGGMTPSGAAGRLGICLAIIAAAIALLVTLPRYLPSLASLTYLTATALILVGGLGALYIGGQAIAMVWFTYTHMQANLKRLYSNPISYDPVNLDAISGAPDDPAVRKLSADMEALGAIHYQDVAPSPALPTGQFTVRLYRMPDDNTLFTLMLMHRAGDNSAFPARPSFLLRTDLEDGFRVLTSNSDAGYQRPLPLPIIGRRWPDIRTPDAMYERHSALIARLVADGRKPTPLVLSEIIPRMVAEHEETRVLKAQRGYFALSDAFHQAFKITRPHFRDDAPFPRSK